METFKIKINFSDRFVIKHVTAHDEADACWIGKDMTEKMSATSFDLMHS